MTTENKTCVVTGGSGGIGLATAKRFASEGYRVSICGRRQTTLDEAVSLFSPENALAIQGDIAEPATQEKLINETIQKFGNIDVLVNNAGAAPLGDFESIDKQNFENVIDINIRAIFGLTQLAWANMKAEDGGSIINISSMAAVDPFPGFSIYGASKAWLETFTKAIAAEGTDHKIRVCCVRPGAVETDLLRGLFPDFPAEQCVSPDEIAMQVWQCVSEPDKHPTGKAFTVAKS
jgi:NAD(P)-dependent dehydrogenase (short-subunit alcohol dehydrogenase family)